MLRDPHLLGALPAEKRAQVEYLATEVEQARGAVTDLLGRVQTVQEKASQSEALVRISSFFLTTSSYSDTMIAQHE